LAPDSGAFTRIDFPSLGHGVVQEDIDTFETILAQCTAFMEREPAPQKGVVAYNPGDYKPGEAYAVGTARPQQGQIVLIDEDDGSVVGELAEDDSTTVVEHPSLKPGRKGKCPADDEKNTRANSLADPVEITVSEDGKRIEVKPLSEDYLDLARHPAYATSSIVQNAAAASRLIVTGSSYLANAMTSGAETFSTKTKPASKPLNFSAGTHANVRRINGATQSVATLSSKTAGRATQLAQNVGASLTRRGERKDKLASGGEYKPGLLNKSMIAFSTLADGIATSGKYILDSGANSATHMVGHRYGEDARKVAKELAQGVTNVGLVYVDVTGVSRRAVIKSVAKGMIVGRVKDGRHVVVGGDDDVTVLGDEKGRKPAKSSGASAIPGVQTMPGLSRDSSWDGAPPRYDKGDYRGSTGEKYS
jgi:spartin